jgi:hypothetical protein
MSLTKLMSTGFELYINVLKKLPETFTSDEV